MLSSLLKCSSLRSIRRMDASSRLFSSIPAYMTVSEEVRAALAEQRAVVALESTIISHGMPYPANIQCAAEVEDIIRSEGAVPATIAIIHGKAYVGLSSQQMESIGTGGPAGGNSVVVKASTRDLPHVLNNRLSASTTVASTMYLAQKAGVGIFATGGIGGVHRGDSMDISPDLLELSRTRVCVVCAGAKSILDLPKTIEVLETLSVPVYSLGTNIFPAFFHNQSNLQAQRLYSAQHAALTWYTHTHALQMRSGMLVGVPNPQPAPPALIEQAIQQATQEAQQLGIHGAKLTPFLLKRLGELTGNVSLRSNVHLIKNNAKVAAQMAVQYAQIVNGENQSNRGSSSSSSSNSIPLASWPAGSSQPKPSSSPAATSTASSSSSKPTSSSVLVVGGACVDIIGSSPLLTPPPSLIPSSYPGTIHRGVGGVGMNMALALAESENTPTTMVTAVGADEMGGVIRDKVAASPLLTLTTPAATPSLPSAVYMALHAKGGDLVSGVADMKIFSLLTPAYLFPILKQELVDSSAVKMIVCDGNLSPESLHLVCEMGERSGRGVFFEPTSLTKAALPYQARCIDKITMCKPNLSELLHMLQHSPQFRDMRETWNNVKAHLDRGEKGTFNVAEVSFLIFALLQDMVPNPKHLVHGSPLSINGKHVFLSLGARGILWGHNSPQLLELLSPHVPTFSMSGDRVMATHLLSPPPLPRDFQGSTNGAGDAFCAGLIGAMVKSAGKKGVLPDFDCVNEGLKSAHAHLLRLHENAQRKVQ